MNEKDTIIHGRVFILSPFVRIIDCVCLGISKTIGDMVGAFQSIGTVEYIRGVKQLGWQPFNCKLLQPNYWEHIIRKEQSYQRIAKYIINNPKNWDSDK